MNGRLLLILAMMVLLAGVIVALLLGWTPFGE